MQHSKPYPDSDLTKKEQITKMFDVVAQNYDLANKILSAGIDKRWRKRIVKMLQAKHPKYILDIATGTADLAISMLALEPEKIVGVDISANMVAVGQKKIERLGHENTIELRVGDAEQLSFPDNSFDAVTLAFGFRNFENRQIGLSEIYRVLKPSTSCLILEFSQPTNMFSTIFYKFYLELILPQLGGLISGHRKAYQYLNQSIKTFPKSHEVLAQLELAGFDKLESLALSGGICRIWQGIKS